MLCSSMPLIYDCPWSVLCACCAQTPPFSSGPNLLLGKSILQQSHTGVCVCVYRYMCVYMPIFQPHRVFPQVTNHRVKDEATAADRLTRSTCAGNHRCYWKFVIHAERASDVNEGERVSACFAVHAGGGGGLGGIHWVRNCNHRSQTQHIFVMSFVSRRSTRDWNPFVAPEPNAQQSDGAVFTLAWDIYHLPLCDVGSKRHWDKQYVKCGSGLTLGLGETVVVLLTAWSCFPSWGNEFP